MSTTNLLVQLIRSCTKEEFDKLVTTYLKVVMHYSLVINSDGPGDGGIDIRVLDIDGRKQQFQLTIQKNETNAKMKDLEQKILSDCKKASNNHMSFGYDKALQFFYSQMLSNSTRRNLEKKARDNSGIELTILDASDIADIAVQYPELESFILDLSPELTNSSNSKNDSSEYSLVYDLVGFGKTADIKKDIVEAYIIQVLYEDGPQTLDGLAENCAVKFHTNEERKFFERLLNNLYSIRKELNYDKVIKTYSLTEGKKAEVDKKLKCQQEDEFSFERAIKDILIEYEQENNYEQYVNCLKDIYTSNFSESFMASSQTDETKLDKLKRVAIQNGITRVKTFITCLLQVCENNKYLQKVCASNVFGKKISLDNLERYARDNKTIYIDTTIALYLLCYYYKPDSNYSLYYYKMAETLFLFCKKHNIKLHIVERYLWELQRNVSEALSLIPFSYCEYFRDLGSTRNVFYNHYLYICEEDESSLSFEEYLSDFGFRSKQTKYELDATIQGHLSEHGIETVKMKEYDKSVSVKIIEEYVIQHNRKKTLFAMDNDAIMMEFLADKDTNVHPLDPVFITWDKTFFEVRDEFFKRKTTAHRWMQFVPNQFVDRYSLLSFSINEETITKEMLAIISDDLVKQTRTLADAIAAFINPDDKVGLKYTKKLAELRESLICNVTDSSDFSIKDMPHSSLDDVIFELIEHYKGNSSFEELFKNESMVDDVMEIINKAVMSYPQSQVIGNEIYESIDNLLS